MRQHIRRLANAKTGVLAVVQTALTNIAVQATNIASGILTARSLGPSGRGSLAAIIMWPQFLAYALSFGIPVASVYWIKRRPEAASDFTGAALVLSVCAGLLAMLLGVITIPYSLHTYSQGTIHFARLAMVLAPFAIFAVTLTAQVQVAGQFKIYNVFRFLSPLSVLVALFIERATGTLTPVSAALAYLLAVLPSTAWMTFWVIKRFRPAFTSFKTSSKTLLSYGLRAWGADMLGMVANQIDRILVVGMLSPEAMGFYVVAQSAAGVLAVLPAAVTPVTMPKMSGLSHQEILHQTGRAVRMTLLVMLLASLPLFIGGRLLLQLVYGNKFAAAALVLPFLVAETIVDGLTVVLSQAFLASGFPGTVTLLEASGLMTAIPLLYWLIPIFGLRGAACALLLGTLVRFTVVLINFPLRLKVRPPSLLVGRPEILTLLRRDR